VAEIASQYAAVKAEEALCDDSNGGTASKDTAAKLRRLCLTVLVARQLLKLLLS